jgi:hypothetical protein
MPITHNPNNRPIPTAPASGPKPQAPTTAPAAPAERSRGWTPGSAPTRGPSAQALPPGWKLPAGVPGQPGLLAAAVGLASNQDAMRAIAEAFGPRLPADAQSTQVKVIDGAPPVRVSRPNYDEGNDGSMSVPGSEGTASMQDILSQPDPARFISEHLSFGKGRPGEPLTVFVPGLNTPEPESERRLEQQYSPVLGDRRMAHLHLGSDQDQGPVQFTVDPSLVRPLQAQLPALQAAGLAPQITQRDGQTFAILAAGQRDRVEAALVSAGLLETQVMTSVKGLLQSQLEGPGGPKKLNLMLYSRGSIDGGAAIASWVEDFTQRNASKLGREGAKAQAQKLLSDNVLVETFGNANRRFPDGPKYIHWSAINDPLTSSVGSTATNPQGGGKGAVYVHYTAPYKGFDAHNLGAVGVQATRLTLELNGVDDPRKLYELAQRGPLKTPTTEQLNARIEQTGGKDWLWSPETALAP